MDDEKLIQLVKSNELIYNKYDADYKSMEKKKATWQRIAREMESTESDCVRRWSCLRDRYTKESRRLTALSNNGMTTSQLWPLFAEMEFLKPHILNRSKSILGTSSYSVKLKEPSTEFEECDSHLTEQEDPIEYEYLTSFLSKEEIEIQQEVFDEYLPTETQSPEPYLTSSTPYHKRQTSDPKPSHSSTSNTENHHTKGRKRSCEPDVEEELKKALEIFKEVCGAARMRRQNPAVYGFGQMVVETICQMSTRKQAIAMQKVTELVMTLKMEPDSME
ncbi:PREDICTED: uncharacterized protein LOC108372350 [Rhagoletis zephyria]|uniref:uncharacterized protein LOC108372350 n=1 Tax=Rhagoletis zephyria TaxID=28612 RepID=UPI0008112E87|nr:PREDICTED: uncharacterized protein LOC108372350 [Rhagoletis zephyria]